ncbi:MAG: GNAT family N-acetyltransferase [Candidatus Thermoplasmatota archaeon]
MNENIEYRRLDNEDIEKREIEDSIDLLHEYLKEFISREALGRDVKHCFKKGRVVAAYHGDELVGVIVGVYTPFFEKFHIGHIAVEESFQGKGMGTKLTKKIIPEDTGASVHLNMGNPEVERFYEKMGFEQTHKRFKKPSKEDSDVKPSD